MDIHKTLRELYQERNRLDAAIAILEKRARAESRAPARRRGRKHMSAEERLEVSKRMSRYWQMRRAQARALEAAASAAGGAAAAASSKAG